VVKSEKEIEELIAAYEEKVEAWVTSFDDEKYKAEFEYPKADISLFVQELVNEYSEKFKEGKGVQEYPRMPNGNKLAPIFEYNFKSRLNEELELDEMVFVLDKLKEKMNDKSEDFVKTFWEMTEYSFEEEFRCDFTYYTKYGEEESVKKWIERQLANYESGNWTYANPVTFNMLDNEGNFLLEPTTKEERLSEKAVASYVEKFQQDNEGFEKFSEFLYKHVTEDLLSDDKKITEDKNAILNRLTKVAEIKDSRFVEAFHNYVDGKSFDDIVKDVKGIDEVKVQCVLSEYLGGKYQLNLFLETEEEKKEENAIDQLCGKNDDYPEGAAKIFNNAVSYIAKQQGEELDNFLARVHEIYGADYTSLKNNNVYFLAQTVIKTARNEGLEGMKTTVSFYTNEDSLLDTLDTLLSKDETKELQIDGTALVGLFNPDNGNGLVESFFATRYSDIPNGVPLEIPNSLVSSLQVEGGDNKGEHTVREICDTPLKEHRGLSKVSSTDISDNAAKSMLVSEDEVAKVDNELNEFLEKREHSKAIAEFASYDF